MATTQDNRILKIATPLGKDFLLLDNFTATEGISQLFSITADLLHEENDTSFAPTVIDPKSIVGKGVTITIGSEDGTKRDFTGMVNRFVQGGRHIRFSHYTISIVPHVWVLTQNSQSRIFQQMTVPDILKKVFAGFEVKYEIQGTFEPRNYCVQYRENDFAFASRLMEEEGIYYYFEHADSKDVLIIANTPQSHRDCPTKKDIPYFVNVGEDDSFIGSIRSFLGGNNLMTGKVTMWDHNFQLPDKKLEKEESSKHTLGPNKALEFYEYPGGYARKYDGIDKSGGEQAGDLQKVFPDREATVNNLMEALDGRVSVAEGTSDCCSITSGHRFTLLDHPTKELNKTYTITSVRHSAEQSPSYASDDAVNSPYTNSFDCMLQGAGQPPYRPLRITPKPVIQGGQTAYVVGPAGEEIFTDKYGRVKVQFHWDRDGQVNASSSCWVRVAQTWAGNKWGTLFIPRIGMEVLINFLEGDPDQPIIVGCVYNPQSMPPYTLPDEKTKSTIKTNSSTGGNGFNELRFEDKKGSEQIFVHAEKNVDIRIKNDRMEIVKNDRHLIVDNDKLEQVKKDKHVKVGGDHNEKTDGTYSLEAGSDIHEKAGSNVAVEAGSSVHIKAGMSAVIEAGTSLTLKVGGNFININSGGIFIKGTMVMLNSGGMAGSGSGSRPNAPKQAKEADTANPGEKATSPKAPPPVQPVTFSPLSQAFQNAAQNGTPFCETCPC